MKPTLKRGFTVLEVMIVVAIIGILAAIGIPAFKRARERSVTTIKMNNLRMVETAIEQYSLDNALVDGATLDGDEIAKHIKGGLEGLSIGSGTTPELSVTAEEISAQTAGHKWVITDIY